MTTTAFIMKHDTDDVAAYIVELFERTTARDRALGYLDSAIEHKFPGLGIDQLHAARKIAAGDIESGRAMIKHVRRSTKR